MSVRPALPHQQANPHLRSLDSRSLPVKYQILSCQGKEILVGRIKIPTTGTGHAFILRRFDTGAISLTTMFRAAFPSASEIDERRETNWVKEHYDITKFNGSTREHSVVRLAGTWVSPEDALTLAESYSLTDVVKAISKALPDPTANYRRSGKDKNPATSPAPVMSPTPVTSPKRRRESSPPPNVQPTPPASLAVPRRSVRVKSKSPTPSRVSPPKKSGRHYKSKGNAPEHEEDEEETETANRMNDEMRKEDVAEQKDLIFDLKAKRAEEMEESNSTQQKRGREESEQEYPDQLNIKQPESSGRAIATNKRVTRFQLAPREKSFAWGIAAFAVGLGAVTFLPNLM